MERHFKEFNTALSANEIRIEKVSKQLYMLTIQLDTIEEHTMVKYLFDFKFIIMKVLLVHCSHNKIIPSYTVTFFPLQLIAHINEK